MTSKAALARASQLAVRARELRRAQADVQALTLREVETLARTAASFFEILPQTLFSNALLPHTARGARRVRHRILHRVLETTDRTVVLRALLLGRDGMLRVFTARASTSADLMAALDPSRLVPTSVLREVEEWSPAVRVADFRPLEVLDQLSQSLDTVEATIMRAEVKVTAQKDALERGDLTALRHSRTREAAAVGAALMPGGVAPPPAPAATKPVAHAAPVATQAQPATAAPERVASQALPLLPADPSPSASDAVGLQVELTPAPPPRTPARGLFPVLPAPAVRS